MIKLGPDNIKMREYIYSLLGFPHIKAVLDVGCGYGYDLGVTMYIYVGRKVRR